MSKVRGWSRGENENGAGRRESDIDEALPALMEGHMTTFFRSFVPSLLTGLFVACLGLAQVLPAQDPVRRPVTERTRVTWMPLSRNHGMTSKIPILEFAYELSSSSVISARRRSRPLER